MIIPSNMFFRPFLTSLSPIFLIGFLSYIGSDFIVQANYHGEEQDRQHAGMSPVERINALRQYIQTEASANPAIYDVRDLGEFLQDADGSFASKFLNQRSNHVGRAFKLAWQTLRWRHAMGIRNLRAEDFPCDLFELGLIFESGIAHHLGPNGEYIQGNPIIWIRLGALGGVVKERKEKFSAKKMWSTVYHSFKQAGSKTKTTTQRTFHHSYSTASGARAQSPEMGGAHAAASAGTFVHQTPTPMVESMSVKDDRTMNHINRAIAWWLEDWRQRHGLNAKATLVLDFENTDFAFSSWTMGEFFISLDDYFPDLFDQIIGFRYKPRMWSLHSPISMFNRIFKSRFASSPETDRKLRFVKSEVQISNYMPRVDLHGFTMLPDHVSGNCLGPVHAPPAGCQQDLSPLVAAGLIEPEMWAAVRNEFYNICKPQARLN